MGPAGGGSGADAVGPGRAAQPVDPGLLPPGVLLPSGRGPALGIRAPDGVRPHGAAAERELPSLVLLRPCHPGELRHPDPGGAGDLPRRPQAPLTAAHACPWGHPQFFIIPSLQRGTGPDSCPGPFPFRLQKSFGIAAAIFRACGWITAIRCRSPLNERKRSCPRQWSRPEGKYSNHIRTRPLRLRFPMKARTKSSHGVPA